LIGFLLATKVQKFSKGQVAALPILIGQDGDIQVMLVSSRETGRWVIPKGWTSSRMTDPKAAEREARQEAGLTGKIERYPVGYYRYRKVLPQNTRIVEVAVYVLWVRKQHKSWSEQKERTRIWTSIDSASKLVREHGLKKLLSELDLTINAALSEGKWSIDAKKKKARA
jgi:8-oxo-dGTP pyrophosphatase MutT (NUDIX family)